MSEQSERYRLVKRIHEDVNAYPYAYDQQVHGEPEFWERISKAGAGDCEDYVLEKRQRLLDAGVPLSDVRIGTVFQPNGVSHAVLVVRDGDVDWVADQTQPYPLTAGEMKNLGYKGDSLQVPGQFMWEKWAI